MQIKDAAEQSIITQMAVEQHIDYCWIVEIMLKVTHTLQLLVKLD
jgi:hypothetical protein